MGRKSFILSVCDKIKYQSCRTVWKQLCIPLSLVSHLNLQSKIIVDVDILQVRFSFPDNDVSRNWKYFQPIIAYKKHQEMTFLSLSHNGVTLDADRNISTAILLVFIRQWGRLFTCRYLRYIKDTIYITTILVYDIPRIIMWYILIIKYFTRFFSCLDVKVFYNLDPNEQMLVCCWISLLRECGAGMVILWPQHTWQDCFPQPASCCLIE